MNTSPRLGVLRGKKVVILDPRNLGQDAWPEGTSLRLLSGNALGLESLDIDQANESDGVSHPIRF